MLEVYMTKMARLTILGFTGMRHTCSNSSDGSTQVCCWLLTCTPPLAHHSARSLTPAAAMGSSLLQHPSSTHADKELTQPLQACTTSVVPPGYLKRAHHQVFAAVS
eukprot:GHUV01044654.1.p1 GENE.GHUV01044654.1~~GHUV01044654.1.p1  ORF type:complete len:106 (+),score=9.44 GHUV01044654.1:88-405(+)